MASRTNVRRALIVSIVVIVSLIIGELVRSTPSWNIIQFTDSIRLSIIGEQNESIWNISGSNSSILPFTNNHIDVYIDLVQFRQQVKQKEKQCQDLQEDSFNLFKSKPSKRTNFTAEMDRTQIELAFMCGGVLYADFLKAVPKEELYPFERFYLSDPPMWNENTVACHKHSTIKLAASNASFLVGDTVSLIITMNDKKGRPRLKGGDRIQVWLKDVKFNHSVSMKITDFNNGTYLASTVLPWTGTVRVMATLRQPREYFRALAYVNRALKSTLPFAGAYKNSKASEAAPCSPFPIVPGFLKTELCNLTSVNGSPWYCGRASKAELNCTDYQFVAYSKRHIDLPVTPAENKLLKQPVNQHNFLKGDITFNVEATQSGVTRLEDPKVFCNKVSPRSTWYQTVPSGYFYNGTWRSHLCYIPNNPEQIDQTCFKNVNMIFYGDSNSREFYYSVKSKIQCNETVFGTGENYHAPKMCENKTHNFSMQHISHQSPFHLGWKTFLSGAWLHSPQRLLGSLRPEGRYIISFNHYLHFTAHHISLYEAVLRAVRDAIVKLIQRNTQVLIMLRGPHVAERPPYTYYMGDAWSQHLMTLQKETFQNLQDHIIYFPTWDITVASEDTDIHPRCNGHISDLMLQFMCGRFRD